LLFIQDENANGKIKARRTWVLLLVTDKCQKKRKRMLYIH